MALTPGQQAPNLERFSAGEEGFPVWEVAGLNRRPDSWSTTMVPRSAAAAIQAVQQRTTAP